MMGEGRRRRSDGHAFSVSPALVCVARTSVWSQVVRMMGEGRRRRRDGHAFSVSPVLGCVARTSLWSQVVQMMGGKEKE